MSGKPSVVKKDTLIEMIERQPSRSTRTGPDPSQNNISRPDLQLDYVHSHCREVPHELNNDLYKQRLIICKEQMAIFKMPVFDVEL